MQSLLNDIIVGNVFAFMLIFMRLGTALMIMPGIGDTFVTPQIRLLFALALSFVIMPLMTMNGLPQVPGNTLTFVSLLFSEFIIGFFLGTVLRILIAALDTAGTIVSMQAGFANAMIFNPVTATQGSVTGALYSMLGVTLLLTTDMHHLMLAGIVESYDTFPANGMMPEMGGMLEVVSRAVSAAFRIGVQITIPFLVVGLLIQMGFGVLGRLMPQVQIFFLAQPLQIAICLIIMAVTLSVGINFWLSGYQEMAVQLLRF